MEIVGDMVSISDFAQRPVNNRFALAIVLLSFQLATFLNGLSTSSISDIRVRSNGFQLATLLNGLSTF